MTVQSGFCLWQRGHVFPISLFLLIPDFEFTDLLRKAILAIPVMERKGVRAALRRDVDGGAVVGFDEAEATITVRHIPS